MRQRAGHYVNGGVVIIFNSLRTNRIYDKACAALRKRGRGKIVQTIRRHGVFLKGHNIRLS